MPDPALPGAGAIPATPEVGWQNPARADLGGLRDWLTRLVAELAPAADSVGVRFVARREMRDLNRRFRGQDRATDVLSFPGAASGPEGLHLGDIVVCPAIARSHARSAGHSPQRELKVLLLHGVLHCLGHDHETDDGEMERLERRLRRRWITDER